MMTKTNPSSESQSIEGGNYNIVVHSIGNAGASLVPALKKISPLSENNIAALLFQTPSKLFSNLPKEVAEQMNELLLSTGLESAVVDDAEPFKPGDNQHEVALVIKDFEHITDIARTIIELTGAPIEDVRQILCKSPTVLIGKISINTAQVIKKRFEPYRAEVDISNPMETIFDVFIGECSKMEHSMIINILKTSGLALSETQSELEKQTMICSGLSKKQADQLWNRTYRTSLPVKIVNRDFERFDLRLDQAPNTPEFIKLLVASTGMPEKVAHKVINNLPIVLHKNISFADLDRYMEPIVQLGGKATGHLLVFQTFALRIESFKDIRLTVEVIQVLSGIDQKEILGKIQQKEVLDGPFTSPQVQWMQHELKKIGTESKRLLR